MSLLTTPPATSADCMMYQIIKIDEEIIDYVTSKNAEAVYSEDINVLMAKISENNMKLKSFLMTREEVAHKINTKMDLNAYYGIHITEEQIASFINFSKVYDKEWKELYTSMDLNEIQKEILKENTNLVICKLINLIERQNDTIQHLKYIVNTGFETLDKLNT